MFQINTFIRKRAGQYPQLPNIMRMFHYSKSLTTEGHEDYEPTMSIVRENYKGRSFQVRSESFWKYCDPESNRDVFHWDVQEALSQATQIGDLKLRTQRTFSSPGDTPTPWEVLMLSEEAITYAGRAAHSTGLMMCVLSSLYTCAKLLEYDPTTPGLLAQLFLYIQNGIEEIKAMPPAPEEKKTETGELKITIDGHNIYVPVTDSATDLARDMME